MSLRRTFQVLVPMALVGVFVSSAAFSEGCSTEPTAQFIAGLQSQVQVPRDLKTVLLRVRLGGSEQFCQAYNVVNGTVSLPQSIGTANRGDIDLPVEISVIGISSKTADDIADCSFVYSQAKAGTDVRILRRSLQNYVPGRKLYVPMPMRYSCYDKFCDSEGETCKGGICKTLADPREYAKSLVEYKDELVFGTGNLCFPVLEKKVGDAVAPGCMAVAPPPKVIDGDACIFEVQDVPNVPFVGVNVEAVYEGGYLREVLDLDQEEGFYIPDATKPKRFRLAEGLCKGYHAEAGFKSISALAVSGACASKTILQPLCKDNEKALNPENNLVGGAGKILEATKSGLVFLFDTSKDNSDPFQEGGLAQKIVDVALKDPSLKSVGVGLLTVPGTTPATCPTTDAAFDVLPDPSQTNSLIKVSEKLTSFIGQANKSNLRLPDSNVKLGLNAAIKLAGTKLSTLKSAGTVDRSAIVFIGNGPFDSSCSAETPEKAAQDAFAGVAKARTYAVLTAGTSKAQADSLAAAGQGKGYDGTGSSGAASALQAFADISASLTTCRYVDASPSSTAAIEYYNPITLKTVTVANNQACNAGSGAGWHRDGSVIEFCKESCDALQDAYKKSLALSASNGSAPPALPVYFRAAK